MTRVVNLRHEPYEVYAGRAGKGKAGPLGNPFTLIEYGNMALEMFDAYFLKRVEDDLAFRKIVLEAKDRVLGCFCRPRGGFKGLYLCHAQRIAAWLDGKRPEEIE